MPNQHQQIAIIGGGLAGLSCAKSLRDAGLDPIVFDRGRRPGGRIASCSIATDQARGLFYDHGAPMIHVNSDAFEAAASSWVDAGVAAWWRPRTLHEDGRVTGDERVLVGQPCMNSIAEHLASGIDVRTSTVVQELHRDQSQWVVRSQTYGDKAPRIARFDRLVLAMPAVQARRLIDPLSLEGMGKLDRMDSVPNWVLMMTIHLGEFPDSYPDIIDAQDGERIVFSTRKPGHEPHAGLVSCVAYAGHSWSADYRDEPFESMLPILRQRTLEMLNSRLSLGIDHGQIVDERVHRWGLARADACSGIEYLYNAEFGIGCCGDWCDGSDAQAAYLSGVRLAAVVLED